MRQRADGFTLIELLIVLSLITILASMGLAQYRHSVTYAREAVLRRDLFVMRDAIDQYLADKGQYPPTLDALASEGYVRALGKDPVTGSRDTWQTVAAEPDPANPSIVAGVYDVTSGSPNTAMDGSRYSEW